MRYVTSLFLVIFMCSSLTAQFSEVSNQREFSGKMICLPTAGNLAAASAVIANSTVVPATGQIYFPLPVGQTENECYTELMGMGIFEYVEPDWKVFITIIPNDNLYGNQWHHQMIDSEAGWDIATGDPSIVVAICDTGIDPHSDINNQLDGYNATTQLFESQGGDASALHYHGTATTGVAAASGNNGFGVAGVGWNLSKRMLRVSESVSGSTTLGIIQHAIRVAAEQGDHCISVSYSGCDNASNLTVAEYARGLGSLVFWSAGNDNRNLTFGQRDLDKIIVCGGTSQSDNKAGFSAYGTFMDLSAPAQVIWTTTTGNGGNTYTSPNGTSFAAPMVAGVAAVIWSADPTLTADEVELLIKMGCTDKGDPGNDDTFGYGRLSLGNSLGLIGNPTIHRLSLGTASGQINGHAIVPVTLENPEPVHGFSFGIAHDFSALTSFEALPGTDVGIPEYWQYTNYGGTGAGITVAGVFSLNAPFVTIPPGTWNVALIDYQVLSSSDLVFTNTLGTPPLAIEVSVSGSARTPATVPGHITVGTSFRRGDVNGDTTVSISDPISLLLHLFSVGPLQCQDAGDLDDNGSLDLADAMYSLLYIAVNGPPPPVPFNTCGEDQTADTLDCINFTGC